MVRFYLCLVITLLFANGCAGVQSISEEAVEEKLAKIKLGFTTKGEIENLFGHEHTTENFSWSYNLSDTAVTVSQSPRNGWSGLFPVSVATLPTNTRALVTVRFNEHQTVNTLEIHRFFNVPFTNDYFYSSDQGQYQLDSLAHDGAVINFDVHEFDKSAGKLVLVESGANNGQILVEFNKPILHITSINPYDRLSNEYRVFVKREAQFIERICAENCARTAD